MTAGTEVSLSYLSLESIRGRSHRACGWCMVLDNCCIFVGKKIILSLWGLFGRVEHMFQFDCDLLYLLQLWGEKWLQQFVFWAMSYCKANCRNNKDEHGSLTSKALHPQTFGCSEIQSRRISPWNDNFHSSYSRKGKLWIVFLQNIVFT